MGYVSKTLAKKIQRKRRNLKLRNISNRLRLNIFKSNKYLYAQIIDDNKMITLAAASTLVLKKESSGSLCNKDSAAVLGKMISDNAKLIVQNKPEYSVEGKVPVVYDIGAKRYSGVIKAIADSAREGNILDF